MRLAGALLVMTACGGAGLLFAARLDRRVRSLCSILEFLEAVMVELRYSAAPLDEIFSTLCEGGRANGSGIPKSCLSIMAGGTPFPRAFAAAVEECAADAAILPEDASLIKSCGSVLGSTDSEGQLFALEGKRSALIAAIKDAQEKRLTKGRIYRTLGFLAGAGALILML